MSGNINNHSPPSADRARNIAIINAVLDREAQAEAIGGGLAPRLRNVRLVSLQDQKLISAIEFAKEEHQELILWRACSAHLARLLRLDLSNPTGLLEKLVKEMSESNESPGRKFIEMRPVVQQSEYSGHHAVETGVNTVSGQVQPESQTRLCSSELTVPKQASQANKDEKISSQPPTKAPIPIDPALLEAVPSAPGRMLPPTSEPVASLPTPSTAPPGSSPQTTGDQTPTVSTPTLPDASSPQVGAASSPPTLLNFSSPQAIAATPLNPLGQTTPKRSPSATGIALDPPPAKRILASSPQLASPGQQPAYQQRLSALQMYQQFHQQNQRPPSALLLYQQHQQEQQLQQEQQRPQSTYQQFHQPQYAWQQTQQQQPAYQQSQQYQKQQAQSQARPHYQTLRPAALHTQQQHQQPPTQPQPNRPQPNRPQQTPSYQPLRPITPIPSARSPSARPPDRVNPEWLTWHLQQRAQAEATERDQERKAQLRASILREMASGADVLAYRLREYNEVIHPLGPDEVPSEYHRKLLANKIIKDDDMSEEAKVVKFAKEKWWNYWTVDEVEVAREAMGKGTLGLREEMRLSGHAVTKEDLKAIRKSVKGYDGVSAGE